MTNYVSGGLRALGRGAVIGAAALSMAAPASGQMMVGSSVPLVPEKAYVQQMNEQNKPKAGIYVDDNGFSCTVRYKTGNQHVTCRDERRKNSFLVEAFESFYIDGKFIGFRRGNETFTTILDPERKALEEEIGGKYTLVPSDDERMKKESDRASVMLKTVAPENCFALCK